MLNKGHSPLHSGRHSVCSGSAGIGFLPQRFTEVKDMRRADRVSSVIIAHTITRDKWMWHLARGAHGSASTHTDERRIGTCLEAASLVRRLSKGVPATASVLD